MEKNFLKSIFSFGFIFASAVQPVFSKDYLIAHRMIKKDVTAIYYPTKCRRVKTVKNKRGELLERVVTKDVRCPQGKTPHFVRKGTFTNHSKSNINHNHNHNHNSNFKTSNNRRSFRSWCYHVSH